MVLVGTHQTNTALELAPRPLWGTIATGTGNEAWRRVPLVSETLTLDATPIEDPELGDGGAAESAEISRETTRGVITCVAYYDLPVIYHLLGNAMGGMERVKAGFACNNTTITTPGDFSATHYWVPQSYLATDVGSVGAVPPGLSARAWKSGSTTGGYVQKYRDLLPTGFTFEQTQNAGPRWSFPVVAGKPTLHLASDEQTAAALTTVPTTANRIRWDDLTAGATSAPGQIIWGATPIAIKPTRFSLTLDGSWEVPEFLTGLGTLEQPKHTGRWVLTGEIDLPQQAFGSGANAPFKSYLDNVISPMIIRYEGATITGTAPATALNLEFHLRGIRPTFVDPGIAGPGVVGQRVRFTAQVAQISNSLVATEDDYTVQIMIQAHGLTAVDSGATYLTAAQGGNDVPVGELRANL